MYPRTGVGVGMAGLTVSTTASLFRLLEEVEEEGDMCCILVQEPVGVGGDR
jgi:hypothetical protein